MASDITVQNFGHYIVINFDGGVQVSHLRIYRSTMNQRIIIWFINI